MVGLALGVLRLRGRFALRKQATIRMTLMLSIDCYCPWRGPHSPGEQLLRES